MQQQPTFYQGSHLRVAVAPGWQITEDGPFAVVAVAPDRRAVTTVVGNAGVPLYISPDRFVFDKLAPTGLVGLTLGRPRPAAPVPGFPQAWEFDAHYQVAGAVCRGVARCSVAPAYDSATMVLTWAASVAEQWQGYAGWLPQVAATVQIVNPAAFGASGIAAQNLANSMALGRQAQADRDFSQAQWAEVTQQRDASQARINEGVRDVLGGSSGYVDPVAGRVIDLPATNAAYWVHPVTGRIVGHPDATFDPRSPTDAAWIPLRRVDPK